jgi:hypothetical protein
MQPFNSKRFGRALFRLATSVLMFVLAVDVQAQHPVLEHRADGTISVTAQGRWPLVQAVEALRQEYGWIVDYEEPAQALSNASQGRRVRTVALSLVSPTKGTDVETGAIMQSAVNQLNRRDFPRYRVVRTAGKRFTLVPSSSSGLVILDTPIVLATEWRSISQTVDAILAAVEAQCSCRFVHGGIADNELMQVSVLVGSSKTIPARDLLIQALSAAPYSRVWTQTYDPAMKAFAISFEGVVKLESFRDGKTQPPLPSFTVNSCKVVFPETSFHGATRLGTGVLRSVE